MVAIPWKINEVCNDEAITQVDVRGIYAVAILARALKLHPKVNYGAVSLTAVILSLSVLYWILCLFFHVMD